MKGCGVEALQKLTLGVMVVEVGSEWDIRHFYLTSHVHVPPYYFRPFAHTTLSNQIMCLNSIVPGTYSEYI